MPKTETPAPASFTDYDAGREQWLYAVASLLEADMNRRGYTLPPYRVAMGFTSKGAKGKVIGQAWTPEASASGHGEIFLRCDQADSLSIAAVLAHELAHLAVGVDKGHRAPFKKLVYAIGLEGKATATTAGAAFVEWFKTSCGHLGKCPHAALDFHKASSGPKKQAARLLKCACPTCKYTVRLSQKCLDMGIPRCPNEACDDYEQAMLADGESRDDDGEGE